jgi:hypothetical protein
MTHYTRGRLSWFIYVTDGFVAEFARSLPRWRGHLRSETKNVEQKCRECQTSVQDCDGNGLVPKRTRFAEAT